MVFHITMMIPLKENHLHQGDSDAQIPRGARGNKAGGENGGYKNLYNHTQLSIHVTDKTRTSNYEG